MSKKLLVIGAHSADFPCLDLGDYPLTINDAAMEGLIEVFRELEPDII